MSGSLVKRGWWKRWRRTLTVLYLVLGSIVLPDYINWRSAGFVMGVLALQYTPAFGKGPTGSFRYGWLAFFFSLLFLWLPVKTVMFLALLSAVLLFRENFFRRVERTVPLVLLLMTPVAGYFGQIFSFPIRLELTVLAARLIHCIGWTAEAAGNSITCRGQSFSVDPACMGLHMLVVSLLAGLLLMNYYQASYRRRLSAVVLLLLLTLLLGLNIVANLLRIVCLVVLVILPDNPLHGLLGIFFLLVYVLLPAAVVIRWVVRRYGRPVDSEAEVSGPDRSPRVLAGNWLAAAAVTSAVVVSLVNRPGHRVSLQGDDKIPGYTVKHLEGPVLQLNNTLSLVYIKPIPDFYYTDHTPMICWQGSGYSFDALQLRTIRGRSLFEGVLQKDQQVLYTAWWYDNGVRQTASPFGWRWDVLRGGPAYSIVNITAASREQLEKEVERVLEQRPFSKLTGRGKTKG